MVQDLFVSEIETYNWDISYEIQPKIVKSGERRDQDVDPALPTQKLE